MLNLDIKRAALISIDFQTYVFTGSSLQIVGANEALPKAKQVLTAARTARIPIIHTKEVHRPEMIDFGRELDGAESVHCLETWSDTEIYSELAPIEGEFVIAKRRYSSFFGTDLEILLRGLKVDTLILMGTMTNVCVHYTAVDAHQRDYYFHAIVDCCAGSDWESHWAALKAMEYLQTGACISHTDFIEATASFQPNKC
jgi:nicotinamidase-related amidase